MTVAPRREYTHKHGCVIVYGSKEDCERCNKLKCIHQYEDVKESRHIKSVCKKCGDVAMIACFWNIPKPTGSVDENYQKIIEQFKHRRTNLPDVFISSATESS